MPEVLTYIDTTVARQVATSLIGSEVQLTKKDDVSVGINFKVLLSHTQGVQRTTTTKTADLLPEVLADALHDAIQDEIDDLGEVRSKLVAGAAGGFSSWHTNTRGTCAIFI